MKIKVLSVTNTEKGVKELPQQFNEEIRPDLIYRAVLAVQSRERQPYGVDPLAGKKSAAKLSRRRRDWKGSYGMGISRTPRRTISRRGSHFTWVGAFAPQTVGGRRAHPPKAEKFWEQKINKKERRKAIRSALAAVVDEKTVKARGHIIPDYYPFVVESKLESIAKVKELIATIEKLGLSKEFDRYKTSIRAGRGKSRGRKYKSTRGMLIVVSGDCSLIKAAKSIVGVEVAKAAELNAEMLAPGTHIGRLTLFTEGAIDLIEKNKLYTDNPIFPRQVKEKEAKPQAEKKEVKKPAVKPLVKKEKTEKKETKKAK